MAKIKKDSKKKKVLNKKAQEYNLKHVSVNLIRMAEKEYQIYSKSDKIYVKNFSLKIRGNSLEIGETTQKSETRTFNVIIRKQLSELVLEHCKVAPISSVAAKAKLHTQLVAKSLNCHINDAWRSSKKIFLDSKRSVQVNDIIMAKMKTYSAWPGRLSSFTKNNKRASVHFFGTNNIGSVDVIEIVPFELCHDVIKLLLLRKMGQFHKAVLETEAILKVPDNLSLLKEVEALE